MFLIIVPLGGFGAPHPPSGTIIHNSIVQWGNESRHTARLNKFDCIMQTYFMFGNSLKQLNWKMLCEDTTAQNQNLRGEFQPNKSLIRLNYMFIVSG